MSLNNYYTIYKHTSPSGKYYIGVTRQQNLNRRWMSGHGYISCPLFNNAIQKYGWKNFIHEILEDYVLIEEINDRECYWIKLYKSNNRDFGYNIEEGGHVYRTFSEETRKKVSESHFKPVYQLDKNGNIINEFNSILAAAQYIHRDNSSISKCCKGKQKTCGGYMWRYKEGQL